MRRFFRILICFVMICALLVSISPLRAKAEGVLLTAAASMIILGAAGAMGVHFTNATVYDSFYNAALVNEQINRFFTTMGDGVAQLGYYVLEGVAYLSADFLVALGDFFYDSGTLVAPSVFTYSADEPYTFLTQNAYTYESDIPYFVFLLWVLLVLEELFLRLWLLLNGLRFMSFRGQVRIILLI